MPLANTEQFGPLTYQDDAVLLFPRGLPGFEQSRRFVLVKQPELAPLVHLQSLESATLCFLAIPVPVIDATYQPQLSAEDCDTLELDAIDSTHTLLLALLAVTAEGNVTANLLAPVVVNLATKLALQAVRADTRYSHEHQIRDAEVLNDASGEGRILCS